MLQKMAKIQVIGPKHDLHSTVDFLYNLGSVHLEDATKTISPGDTMLRRSQQGPRADVASVLVKVSGMVQFATRTACERTAEGPDL